MNHKIAFLVLSCDKYSDLWEPYAQLFERYWPDCPFDKYFASNEKPFNEYGFQSILMGEDKTWSLGLKTALSSLKNKYEYVLITLEDLFLIKKVDNEYISSCIDEFVRQNGHYLKLYTKTKIHKPDGQYIGTIRHNVPYRQNCVYTLWKIDTLFNVLLPGQNAWEFEKINTKKTAEMDGFYFSGENAFVIINAVIKGKWVKRELSKIKQELPSLSVSRELLSEKEERRLYWYEKLFKYFFSCVPPLFQSIILKIFSKNKNDEQF
jgi:hypothetical protein